MPSRGRVLADPESAVLRGTPEAHLIGPRFRPGAATRALAPVAPGRDADRRRVTLVPQPVRSDQEPGHVGVSYASIFAWSVAGSGTLWWEPDRFPRPVIVSFDARIHGRPGTPYTVAPAGARWEEHPWPVTRYRLTGGNSTTRSSRRRCPERRCAGGVRRDRAVRRGDRPADRAPGRVVRGRQVLTSIPYKKVTSVSIATNKLGTRQSSPPPATS